MWTISPGLKPTVAARTESSTFTAHRAKVSGEIACSRKAMKNNRNRRDDTGRYWTCKPCGWLYGSEVTLLALGCVLVQDGPGLFWTPSPSAIFEGDRHAPPPSVACSSHLLSCRIFPSTKLGCSGRSQRIPTTLSSPVREREVPPPQFRPPVWEQRLPCSRKPIGSEEQASRCRRQHHG